MRTVKSKIDANDKTCGECRWLDEINDRLRDCILYEDADWLKIRNSKAVRCQQCLDAEEK